MVRCSAIFPACSRELTEIPNVTARLLQHLKQKQVTPVLSMISDRSVTTPPSHVACLPFAVVAVHLIGQAVRVPVLHTSFAGEKKKERFVCRSGDAALPLAPELVMKFPSQVYVARN